MKWVLVVGGLLGAMALAAAGVSGWMAWRRRALRRAGERLGLRPLGDGERLAVPLVPLIDRPRRQYATILAGSVGGRPAAYFDLFVGAGDDWNLQSTVLLLDPAAQMPPLQLRRPRWSMITQRTRGRPVDLPARAHDMRCLKLTSDDPDWARQVFTRAPASFLERVREGRWSLEALGHALVIYRWGARVAPSRLDAYVREAVGLGAEMFALSAAARGTGEGQAQP